MFALLARAHMPIHYTWQSVSGNACRLIARINTRCRAQAGSLFRSNHPVASYLWHTDPASNSGRWLLCDRTRGQCRRIERRRECDCVCDLQRRESLSGWVGRREGGIIYLKYCTEMPYSHNDFMAYMSWSLKVDILHKTPVKVSINMRWQSEECLLDTYRY